MNVRSLYIPLIITGFLTLGCVGKSNYEGTGLSRSEAAKLDLEMAQQNQKNGYVAEAAVYFERAREKNPKLRVEHQLAVLYDQMGMSDRAEAEYLNALKRDRKNPDVLNNAGYFYYTAGRYSEAETMLRRALDADPDHKAARVNLGLTLGMMDRMDEALQTFKLAVSDAEAHSNLGMILIRQGNLDEAERELNYALSRNPRLDAAYKGLAWIEQERANQSDSDDPILIRAPEEGRVAP